MRTRTRKGGGARRGGASPTRLPALYSLAQLSSPPPPPPKHTQPLGLDSLPPASSFLVAVDRSSLQLSSAHGAPPAGVTPSLRRGLTHRDTVRSLPWPPALLLADRQPGRALTLRGGGALSEDPSSTRCALHKASFSPLPLVWFRSPSVFLRPSPKRKKLSKETGNSFLELLFPPWALHSLSREL